MTLAHDGDLRTSYSFLSSVGVRIGQPVTRGDVVGLAGGVNLFGSAGAHSPWMTFERLRDEEPDAIVVMPCGFDIDRTRRGMAVLAACPGWAELKAVGERMVFLTDGNQYFNRPGPRLVESLEILAEILHPEAFHFGHQGKGWVRL